MFKKYFSVLKSQLQKPEFFFLYTASFFGLVFAFLVPPLQTPDEYTHFLRSYEVSELKSPQQFSTSQGQKGSYLPRSIEATGNQLVPEGIMGDRTVKYDIGHIKAAYLNIPLNKNDITFYKTASNPAYSPIVYIPQAVILSLLKPFELPVVISIYMVRLANLAIWLFLIFLAIKLIPWKKWGVAILALLPMTVSQSVSGGVDALLLGLSVLLLAYLLNIRFLSRTVKPLNIILLVAIFTILILCKTISVVLLPMVLILRNSQFSSKRLAIGLKILTICAPIFIYALWVLLSKDLTVSATNLNMPGQNTIEQVRFLASNPLVFLSVLFNMTFFNYSDTIFQAVIGVFGAYDTPLPSIFTTLGYILILFVVLVSSTKEATLKKLTPYFRVGLSLMALIYLLCALLAMYLFATAVGESLISGVQGRYFSYIPYLLMIAFCGYGVTISHSTYVRALTSLSVLVLIASIVTVFSRYYIETPVF